MCFPNDDKKQVSTQYAPLCALGQSLVATHFFIPFYAATNPLQKTVVYRPMDKILALLLSEMVGCQTLIGVNYTVKPDKALQKAWGLCSCPDQSTISATIESFDTETCQTLEFLITQQFATYSPLRHDKNDEVIIDIDLSSIVVCGKQLEGAKKGYTPGKKNKRLRKVVRIYSPSTGEIISDWLVPGNFVAENVIKETIERFEFLMNLSTREQRQRFILRLDSGFGEDACLNRLLARGYHLITKMKSSRRASKLAKEVPQWDDAPSQNGETKRVFALVGTPKRYCRTTKQVILRFQKGDGTLSYQVLVTTLCGWDDRTLIQTYDQRVAIESRFSQDKQGLGLAKRKKKTMLASEVLLLLGQLAHNLLIWFKDPLIQQGQLLLNFSKKPVESGLPLPQRNEASVVPETTTSLGSQKPPRDSYRFSRLIQHLQSYGIVRFIRQIVCISGQVSFSGTKVALIRLNPSHPLTELVATCLERLLLPIKIPISLGEI